LRTASTFTTDNCACLRIPTDPDQGEHHEGKAQPIVQDRPMNEPVLKEEDQGEQRDRDEEHTDLAGLG
jgi:hypothetical protein